MLATVLSLGLAGIDGFLVRAEINLAPGMPSFDVVGLPDAAVRESRERVRAALRNCGEKFPPERLTVNLAPADLKKEGPAFDLPIALGVLGASGALPSAAFEGTAVIGELSLDGSVRPVRGALPMVIAALEAGIARMLFPAANLREVCAIEGIELLPVAHLDQAIAHFAGRAPIAPAAPLAYQDLLTAREHPLAFSDVKGQRFAKRALEIAAAGGHNVLMIGAPGSGKTLMARCIPTILPDMTFPEALEVTRIHSISGSVPETGLLIERPFRSPHHTASHAALVGGGISAMPGEISKAHNGVLFLDELPEYRRDVLEALRQPLEDGFVTVVRVNAQATYPAQFTLVCSMNPCPCGNLGNRAQPCRCAPGQIRRYLNRISGPLLDRIDMHIEVESIPSERLSEDLPEEPSAAIRARVERARAVQAERYKGEGLRINAQLNARTLNAACPMTDGAKALLKLSSEALRFSNRAYTRILKVARTVADLGGSDRITEAHVSEAVQYRTLDAKYWG